MEYICFKSYYKIIAIDLSKQQAFDADLEEIKQTNFTGNLDRAEKIAIVLIKNCEKILNVLHNFILLWYNINIRWLNVTL